MQTLGTNSIRVYHVDPTADHSGCMGVFAKAGIYVLVDLDTFSTYILPVSGDSDFGAGDFKLFTDWHARKPHIGIKPSTTSTLRWWTRSRSMTIP
jgi:hypothetical protein